MTGDRQQGGHPDLGPELRALAQAILDRIDPAVRTAAALAAARTAAGPEGKGPCQQVWCPVCALAAVAAGEEHPLLTVIAEHSVALLAVVRAMIDGSETGAATGDGPDGPPDGSGPGDGTDAGEVPQAPGRYQHIPVIVEE